MRKINQDEFNALVKSLVIADLEKRSNAPYQSVEDLDMSGCSTYQICLQRIVFRNCILPIFRSGLLAFCTFIDCKITPGMQYGTTFKNCQFENCDMSNADMRFMQMVDCTFNRCNVEGADFSKSFFCDHYLDVVSPTGSGTTLFNAAKHLPAYGSCPEEGAFVGFKKVARSGSERAILKLLVPEHAQRRSVLGSNKFRVSEVVPLAGYFETIERKPLPATITTFNSFHDNKFVYEIGVPAIPDGFDDHSISVCTVKGIHMFLTFQEALEY